METRIYPSPQNNDDSTNWGNYIDIGILKAMPDKGLCVFCAKILDADDLRNNVCSTCWQQTFEHQFRESPEDGFCIDCGCEEDDKYHVQL